MTRLLLATRNLGKIRELLALLGAEPLTLETLDEHPEVGEVEETGHSFEDNARLKATQCARSSGLWSLGEDSGLEVDALDGRPGVYSARYAGVHGDDTANNAKLVRELSRHDDYTARYICVMALARPDGEIAALTRGVCEGRIILEGRGKGGFGYDPHFVPEAATRTMAELEADVKAALSHRGQALRAMLNLIRMHLEQAGTAPPAKRPFPSPHAP